jgi:transglutaminase-like putative cysteine protease
MERSRFRDVPRPSQRRFLRIKTSSAWFEVYLGDRWRTLDARYNKPRIGRILMARGRYATDVAIVTSFGPCKLTKFKIFTDEVS